MTNIKIDKYHFEGPMDLLLSLIEEKKLNISEIALAEVTEQFLAHVRSLEAAEPAVLADFLAIAAKLLVIKSRTLLPELALEIPPEEQDAARDLEGQLILYKQFRDLAKGLKKLTESPAQSFARTGVFSERISFFSDSSITPDILYNATLRIVQGLQELENLPVARVKEVISIQEKIAHLQSFLVGQIETRFSHVLSTAKTKHEAIVTFLALLELIKQRILSVEQESSFAEITIRKLDVEMVSVVE